MPEAFKLGMQSDQFGREMALKGAEAQTQALRSGAEIGLQAGSQANAMAMNVANLRFQQEENAQRMQLAWQQEANALAEKEAALQEAAHRTDLEHALSQQQLQQQSLMNEHKLAVEREYRQSQLGLNAMKLQEQKAQFAEKTKQAADRMVAQRRIQGRIANGEDPVRVYMEEGLQAGMSAGGMGTALSAQIRQSQQARIPEDIDVQQVDVGNGRTATVIRQPNPSGSVSMHVVNPPSERSDLEQAHVNRIIEMKQKQILQYETQLGTDEKLNAPIQVKMNKLQKEIDALEGKKATRTKTSGGPSGPVVGRFNPDTGQIEWK